MGAMQYRLRDLALPLLFAAAACARPARDPRSTGSYSYEVTAPSEGSRVVSVEATFEGSREGRLALPPSSMSQVKDMEVWSNVGWKSVARQGGQWLEPLCAGTCKVRYSIDLGALAATCGDEIDCAKRVGDATLSPALAWLVHPQPKTDVPVTVHVRTPNATQFITGMTPADDEASQTYAFRSFDLDEGSFSAFGPMRRYRVEVPGKQASHIDLSIVGKQKYAMTDLAMKTWVEDAAQAVTGLFGQFPVAHTTLFVVPAKGEDEVVFGKVLSLAGASVVVVVGDKMPANERHHDWVLVHELFHLGFPTFRGEGRWLGEGLATYYEPILRARAGWTDGNDVYRQFAHNMPRGQSHRGSAALAQRDDLDSIYWGGALFCFAADVRIREETHGKKSLDDVLRAGLLRGGDATKVWTVADVVKLGDEVTGTRVLSEMYDRYAARGEKIDLDGLLSQLGIDRRDSGGVDFDERRSLAWVRRDILEKEALVAGKHP